jgi:hypothetical protein
MIRSRFLTWSLAIAATLGLSRAAMADDAEAKAIAVKVTTAGAALFDAKDAAALAATYVEGAKIELIGKDESSKEYRAELKQGRIEIEAYYKELFKNDPTFHSKSTVEFAQELRPDLILFTGYFIPDTQSADQIRIPFVQTRVKQGENWKILSLKIFVILEK